MEQQQSQDWFSSTICHSWRVNSPVRAFNAVEGTPPFIVSAEGPYMTDEDGNRYIDLIGSWGPMIVGHAHPTLFQPFTKLRQRVHRLVHQPRQKSCLQNSCVMLIQHWIWCVCVRLEQRRRCMPSDCSRIYQSRSYR